MNGSWMSHSGLAALPSNEVGRDVKLLLDEKDLSERVEQEEDDRCLSQSTCSISSPGDIVWAGGVCGGPLRYEAARSFSLGDGSVILWCHTGRAVEVGLGTSIDGIGMSDANRVAGNALLRLVKLSMLIFGRRTRMVEWCGGGGSCNSEKVWSGVLGSSMPSQPIGAKLRGRVIDMPEAGAMVNAVQEVKG
jgi:hypothetical protein